MVEGNGRHKYEKVNVSEDTFSYVCQLFPSSILKPDPEESFVIIITCICMSQLCHKRNVAEYNL